MDPILLAVLRRSADASERLAVAIEGQTAALAQQADAITRLAQAVGALAIAGEGDDPEPQDEGDGVMVDTLGGKVRAS